VAAATIASVAPFGVTGLDWFAGMAQENIDEFGAALKGEAAISEFLEKAAQAFAPSAAGGRGRAWRPGHGGRQECPHGRVRRGPGGVFRRSVSTGIAGWRDDDLAFTRPWGIRAQERSGAGCHLAGSAGTAWFPSTMAGGLRQTSRARKRGSSTTKVTCHSSTTSIGSSRTSSSWGTEQS